MENGGKIGNGELVDFSPLFSGGTDKGMSSSGKQPAPQCRLVAKTLPMPLILLLPGDLEGGFGDRNVDVSHCCQQTEKAAFSKH